MIKKLLAGALLTLVAGFSLLVFLVVQPLLYVGERQAAPAVDPTALERHVRVLSEDFHPRCFDHPDNMEKAVAYITSHFKNAGGRVERQDFETGGLTYSNVAASFGPESGPALIIGAHYDSFGDTSLAQPLYTPGADDNASGVAGLLALADLLGEKPPEGAIVLVAYNLEEPPFFATEGMGSYAHAASLTGTDRATTPMISLEMLGYFDDAEGSQTYPLSALELLYPTRADFIAVVGRFQDMGLTRTVKAAMCAASGLPVYSMNALPAIPGVDFSDHRNYWRFGHPAVMITDTAFYRNNNYHQSGDTADTLDYARMAKVVQGVYLAALELARQ